MAETGQQLVEGGAGPEHRVGGDLALLGAPAVAGVAGSADRNADRIDALGEAIEPGGSTAPQQEPALHSNADEAELRIEPVELDVQARPQAPDDLDAMGAVVAAYVEGQVRLEYAERWWRISKALCRFIAARVAPVVWRGPFLRPAAAPAAHPPPPHRSVSLFGVTPPPSQFANSDRMGAAVLSGAAGWLWAADTSNDGVRRIHCFLRHGRRSRCGEPTLPHGRRLLLVDLPSAAE